MAENDIYDNERRYKLFLSGLETYLKVKVLGGKCINCFKVEEKKKEE